MAAKKFQILLSKRFAKEKEMEPENSAGEIRLWGYILRESIGEGTFGKVKGKAHSTSGVARRGGGTGGAAAFGAANPGTDCWGCTPRPLLGLRPDPARGSAPRSPPERGFGRSPNGVWAEPQQRSGSP